MKKDIHSLLKSFYEGNTSPEDELFLHEYFNNDEIKIPDELLKEREIFLRFYNSEIPEIPENLKNRLDSLIDKLEAKEANGIKHRYLVMRKWMTGAAACILIVFAGLLIHEYNSESNDQLVYRIEIRDTFSNPQEAYDEACKALSYFAYNFNKGANYFSKVSNGMEISNNVLNKTFKRNDHINADVKQSLKRE